MSLRVTNLIGFGVGGGVVFTDHGDIVDLTNLTTFDFANVTTTRRHSLIIVGGAAVASGRSVSSVIIDPAGDNVSMTELLDYSGGFVGSSLAGAFYIADKVIANKTVRVTFTGTFVEASITIVSLSNLISESVVDTDANTTTGGTVTLSGLSAAPAGGICFAGAFASGGTFSDWAPLTEIADIDVDGERHGVAAGLNYDGSTITIVANLNIAAGGIILR